MNSPISVIKELPQIDGDHAIKVSQSVTINRPADELFSFWRHPANLAQIIHHPATITETSGEESHWVVSAPGGRKVEWDSVIFNEDPGKLIAWRSKEGADVPNAGTVRFEPAPGDEGTEVTVQIEYRPPGGHLGELVAKFTRDAGKSQVYDALRRLKALIEAGEIPTTEGQPVGGSARRRKARK